MRIFAFALIVCILIIGGCKKEEINISTQQIDRQMLIGTWWSEDSTANESFYDNDTLVFRLYPLPDPRRNHPIFVSTWTLEDSLIKTSFVGNTQGTLPNGPQSHIYIIDTITQNILVYHHLGVDTVKARWIR